MANQTGFRQGHIPWNKGKTKEDCPQMSNSGVKQGQLKGRVRLPFSKEWRANISLGRKNNPKVRGENHWNWKGGISSEDKKVRQTLEYEIWRQEVYKKDNWTCRLCGKKCKKDIIAHHLKLFSVFPELRFSVDNGITLCRSCHKKIHKDIGLETRFKKH